MGNIGWTGIIIIAVLVVILFGKGKISSIMGDLAKGIKSFKKGMSDNSDATAIGATLIASNNTFLSTTKRTKYIFNENKMHDYLINKYYIWKKLVDNSTNPL